MLEFVISLKMLRTVEHTDVLMLLNHERSSKERKISLQCNRKLQEIFCTRNQERGHCGCQEI